MMWDVSDEHEVCYKDKDVLKKVNDLTNLFDDVLYYIYETYDHSEYFIDVFYTETKDVGTGMCEQLMKYLNMFVGKKYRQKFIDKYSNDSCVCELITSGTINDSLNYVFNIQYGKRKFLDDPKVNELLHTLSDKISSSIGTSDAECYKITKSPRIFDEFYPSIVFAESCIRCGNYTFLIIYGTSD